MFRVENPKNSGSLVGSNQTKAMNIRFCQRVALCALMVLSAVWWSGCSTVPVTERSQLTLLTPGEEMELGLTSFEQLKKDTPISKDPAANALVQKVGQRIAAVAQANMPKAQWEFVVFDSPEANAFCLPGGKVGIYTGILPITRDEAGLATVIGHEVAHAVARHGGERVSEAILIQGFGALLGAGLSKTDPAWQAVGATAYGVTTTLGRQLPHSRRQESEADRIGLIYMARAGYDPEAAVLFWQRFAEAKQQGDDVPAWLRTHPSDETRIRRLKQWMPEAKAQFRPAN